MKKGLSLLLSILILTMGILPGIAQAQETIQVNMVRPAIDDRIISALGTDESSTDNRWTRMLRDEYGIEVNYLWSCAEGEYGEKLGFALSSGDLPDVIPFKSYEQLHQAYEAGYLQDLSGVFDAYASDLLKEVFSYDNGAGFSKVTFNGFVSAFPGITPSYDSNPILYIRKDWLDRLGLSDPTCTDDLLEIIRAFSEDDPDGNGVRDTYGLSMASSLTNGYACNNGLLSAWGAQAEWWYADEEGKVHYGSVEPEMKEGLAVLHEMYEKGYINPEFFTITDGNVALEEIVAGKVGVVYSMSWFPWLAQSSHNMDGAMWCAYPLVSQQKDVIAPTALIPGFEAYYGVRAGYEHPEVVVLMANAFVEKIWGNSEEGASYWFGVGDQEGIWHLAPVAFLHPLNNFLIYEGFKQIAETGTTEGVFPLAEGYYESCLKYRNEGDESNWACEYVMSENPYSSNAANQKTFEAGAGYNRLSTWTQASYDYGDVLKQIINPAMVKVITGEYTEAEWDAAVENWLSSGGQAWIDEIQAWYDALK